MADRRDDKNKGKGKNGTPSDDVMHTKSVESGTGTGNIDGPDTGLGNGVTTTHKPRIADDATVARGANPGA